MPNVAPGGFTTMLQARRAAGGRVVLTRPELRKLVEEAWAAWRRSADVAEEPCGWPQGRPEPSTDATQSPSSAPPPSTSPTPQADPPIEASFGTKLPVRSPG